MRAVLEDPIPPPSAVVDDCPDSLEQAVLKALDRARGNKSLAARLLGLTRRTLYSRMEKHGLRRPGEGDAEEGDEQPE